MSYALLHSPLRASAARRRTRPPLTAIPLLAVTLLLLALPSRAAPPATGVLTDTGQLLTSLSPPTPANGSYDLQFQLFNAATAGTQVGATQTLLALPVVDGVFYAEINFGAVVGTPGLYLQTAYRLKGTTAYTVQTPRKRLSESGYADYATTAGTATTATTATTSTTTKALLTKSLSAAVPTTGQVLTYNGTLWAPATSTTGGAYTAGAGLTLTGSKFSVAVPLTLNTAGTAPALSVTNTYAGGGNGLYAVSANEAGVYGVNTANGNYGMLGSVEPLSGHSVPVGVFGYDSTGNSYGVYGYSGNGTAVAGTATTGFGLVGLADTGIAVYGESRVAGGSAGYFVGNVTVEGDLNVTGTLTKAAGSFKIDSPLHPATEFLSHSFVESPDMMNVYDGNVVTDAHGRATVRMPAYFQALNQDFRYVLTCLGRFAPVYVSQEMHGNRFGIAGGTPGLKVSWMVTGIRHDAWANAHRIPTEERKPAREQGLYLNPVEQGRPARLGIGYVQRQAHLRPAPPAGP